MSTTSTVSISRKQEPIILTDAAGLVLTRLTADHMFFDTEVAEDDLVRSFGEVKVVVDPKSAELLLGASLDYSDGLQGAGFHITNPNATSTCGCGSSFS